MPKESYVHAVDPKTIVPGIHVQCVMQVPEGLLAIVPDKDGKPFVFMSNTFSSDMQSAKRDLKDMRRSHPEIANKLTLGVAIQAVEPEKIVFDHTKIGIWVKLGKRDPDVLPLEVLIGGLNPQLRKRILHQA